MATLTRPKAASRKVSSHVLDSQIPSPFPREQLAHSSEAEQIQSLTLDIADSSTPSTTVALKDVMPSIEHVQRSCLMTLNNLLSEPIHWSPILPNRRHSMPSSPTQAPTSFSDDSTATPALQTLLTNLRNHEANSEMIEAKEDASDAQLLSELKRHVDRISESLSAKDASLARALVSLLTDLNRLSNIETSISYLPTHALSEDDAPPPIDLLDTLTRQLSDLQIQRLSSQVGALSVESSPLIAVETALLWSRIDTELDSVVAMCKERTEALPKFAHEQHLPPQYDLEDYEDDFESPPDYDPAGRASFDDSRSKIRHSQQTSSLLQPDEKMRLDLEAVTMAIDRLYSAAPQLHSQRVELKSSKVAQMERARQEGQAASSSLARNGKDRDVRELENLLELIGKASDRTMKDQSVVLDSTMQAKMLERSRRRELLEKDAFVEQLIQHSGAGRLHGQDAVLQPRMKDPEAMLTLPEFMRESLPLSERNKDLNAMLTLPEFVREAVPPHLLKWEPEVEAQLPEMQPSKSKEKKRHRSLSAPPLAWLRSISSSSQVNTSTSSKGKARMNHIHETNAFDVVYVAENHEVLRHVLVFFTVTGLRAGATLEAEIISPFPGGLAYGGGGLLVIKSGPLTSLPLLLPAHTAIGPKEVRAQSGHYDIKLMTQSSRSSSPDNDNIALLDATQLTSIEPTSFLCASCSLPVVQSSRVNTWRDLPSEHWEELVEAWMCHGDQKLHDHVQRHSKGGFWPAEGLALVGGSYILFDESAMNTNNILVASHSRHDDNWQLTRCLCGAIVGRCQERETETNASTTVVHRILKYAVRPVSLTADLLRIPLSAFIVEDMMEFVHAHASYRFVIHDEEEEKARILIWLFKPKMHLAYTTPRSRAIPKSANIVAAKVLFKLIKPVSGSTVDIKSILNIYPNFPQAEYLFYPMSICRRLASMLRESNTAYPESLRMMTGLEVGWLQRAS